MPYSIHIRLSRNHIQEFMSSFPDFSRGFCWLLFWSCFGRNIPSYHLQDAWKKLPSYSEYLNHAFRHVQQVLDTTLASSYIFHHLSLTFSACRGDLFHGNIRNPSEKIHAGRVNFVVSSWHQNGSSFSQHPPVDF